MQPFLPQEDWKSGQGHLRREQVIFPALLRQRPLDWADSRLDWDKLERSTATRSRDCLYRNHDVRCTWNG